MKKTLIFIVAVIYSLVLSDVYAQSEKDDLRNKYGLFAAFNYNIHVVDFRALPGVPNCCPKFTEGDGWSYQAGITFEYPLLKSFYIGSNVGYYSLNGQLSAIEPTTIYYNNEMNPGKFKHTIDVTMSVVTLEPKIGYNLFGGLFIHTGFGFSFPIQKDYSQEERIIEPKGQATFIDEFGNDTKSMIRNQNSGEIKDVNSILMSIMGSVSYDLPLNKKKTLLLSPGISFRYGLNDIIKDYDWKINSFSANLTLYYSPEPYREPIKKFKEIYHIYTLKTDNDMITTIEIRTGLETSYSNQTLLEDTLFLEKHYDRIDTLFYTKIYELTADIDIVSLDSLKRERPLDKIKVEELHYSQMHPLLNYIFFEENSAKIRDKYVQVKSKSEFDFNKLNKFETMSIYYNALNIVGYRLSQTPRASITLTGCNNTSEIEKGNTGLSKRRAESIKNYLTEIWNVSNNRIKIITRGLPSKPSTPVEEKVKREENQRVEISSNNSKILEPVTIIDTMRVFDPKSIRFKPVVDSEAGLENLSIKLNISSESYTPFKDISNVNQDLDYKLFDLQNHLRIETGNLNYGILARDIKGNEFASGFKSIPIEVLTIQKKQTEERADKVIEKYNLILFDFNSNRISGDNLKIVKYIKSRAKQNSKVDIIGYTDRTGGEEHNKYLSLIRAKAAYNKLKFWKAKFKGVGSDVELFDNSTPEGRFYSRTVEILIENPLKY